MSDHLETLRAALVGRYVVEREIGAGGMATVYLADDLKHDRKVAVKVLNPILASVLGSQRFFREIGIAAKLNHPNILTLIDSGDADGLLYYVMPYVPQSSLRARLDRDSQLAIDEATRVTEQVASALHYAHRQGIVHRDVKPENVLLHEGVATIADFGIALSVNETQDGRLTGAGLSLGTPEYMSPEQASGNEPDARSDIYSLGCVLYEMLVGHSPYSGANSQAILAKVLTEPIVDAQTLRSDLSPGLNDALKRALARRPEDRFSTMAEFGAAVADAQTMASVRATGPHAMSRIASSPTAWGVLIAVSLGVGAVVATYGGASSELATGDERPLVDLARSVEPRPSIAVLGFKNLSGRDDVAWLSTALAEMLTTELTAGGALRTIPGEIVSRMKRELSLAEEDSYGAETLSAIRNNIGTDMVVLGSFAAVGNATELQLRMDVRLQHATTGETIAAVAETGAANELFDVIARAGTRLRDELGMGGLALAGEEVVHPLETSNVDATRLYTQGLERLRQFDANGARALLEQSLQADPGYVPAHSALSEVWSQLGYDQRASNEARLAFEQADNLPDVERLLVEARYRETQREWDRAIEIYRSLWQANPDNIEYGLQLASAQRVSGARQDAMATVGALKELPPAIAGDARIQLAECHLAELLSEHERQQRACAEARITATAQGALLLVARSWFLEGRSWFFLNDAEKALAGLDEARRMYERTGHRSEVANVMNASGIVRRTRGDRAGARRDAEAALAIKREVGDRAGTALALNGLGIVVQQEGDLDRAIAIYEEAIAINREIGSLPSVPAGLINLANVYSRLGQLERTRQLYHEAAEIAAETDNLYVQALALNNVRATEYDMGNLAEARAAGEEALRIFSGIGHQLMLGYTTFGMAEMLAAEDDLAGARVWLDSSLALREAMGLQTVAETRRAIAGLLLDEGRHAEAERWVREIQEGGGASTDADKAMLDALLANALALQGKRDEARVAADRARALVTMSSNTKRRIQVAVLAAPALANAENFQEELQRLREARREAIDGGYAVFQMEAQLAIGTMQVAYGDAAAGRASLRELQREAEAAGFALIARKAAAAATQD